jgi:tartrate-resistant acid phosphatase type 5
MPEFHSEPYVCVAGVTHKSALIAWGAFYFRVKPSGGMKLVDDDDLQWVHPPRSETIGARSAPYGPARVEVRDAAGALVASAQTNDRNHCMVAGLLPDTAYSYTVFVKNEEWAAGERWDWVPDAKGLRQVGRRYDNTFRTLPDPSLPLTSAFSFIVIGDFGTGICKPSTATRRQREVALALETAVTRFDARFILTTGDNIYGTHRFLRWTPESGEEDDDWFFTFYQPYRYVLNRIPVYPSIGNHDAGETEAQDDRGQLMDNLFLAERLIGEEAAGRASVGPGLFYRFRAAADLEFICLDTSKEQLLGGSRLFRHPNHAPFVERTFAASSASEPASELTSRPQWRIAFCHHPPFSAGPRWGNTADMETLVSQFERGGVRLCFSGHEHNFQHSRWNGVDYFVTGAGSKVRLGTPDRLGDAHTLSWASQCHFLLVTIDRESAIVRAIGDDETGEVKDIARFVTSGELVQGPIEISP